MFFLLADGAEFFSHACAFRLFFHTRGNKIKSCGNASQPAKKIIEIKVYRLEDEHTVFTQKMPTTAADSLSEEDLANTSWAIASMREGPGNRLIGG